MSGSSGPGFFGPYRLDAVLVRNALVEVHRAYDTRRERWVSLRFPAAHLVADAAARARFRRDCEIAARLTEPHIVPIHDFGEIGGRCYVDMRLIDGRELAAVLAAGPMRPAAAVAIVEQVADALDAAHVEGLVHGTLGTDDVLVDTTGFASLTGFGLCGAGGDRTTTRPAGPVPTVVSGGGATGAPPGPPAPPVTAVATPGDGAALRAVDIRALAGVLGVALGPDAPPALRELAASVAGTGPVPAGAGAFADAARAALGDAADDGTDAGPTGLVGPPDQPGVTAVAGPRGVTRVETRSPSPTPSPTRSLPEPTATASAGAAWSVQPAPPAPQAAAPPPTLLGSSPPLGLAAPFPAASPPAPQPAPVPTLVGSPSPPGLPAAYQPAAPPPPVPPWPPAPAAWPPPAAPTPARRSGCGTVAAVVGVLAVLLVVAVVAAIALLPGASSPLSSGAETQTWPLDGLVDEMAVSGDGTRLYVLARRGASSNVRFRALDTSSGAEVAAVDLSDDPWSMHVLDDGRVFLRSSGSAPKLFDPRLGTSRSVIIGTRDIAVDMRADGRVLYVNGRGSVSDIGAPLGIVEIDLVAGTRRFVAEADGIRGRVDPAGRLLYLPRISTTLQRVDLLSGSVQEAPVPGDLVGISPDSRYLVFKQIGDQLSVLEASSGARQATAGGDGLDAPLGVTVGSQGVYFSQGSDLKLLRFGAGTAPQVVAADAVTGGCLELAVAPDGSRAYCADLSEGIKSLSLE